MKPRKSQLPFDNDYSANNIVALFCDILLVMGDLNAKVGEDNDGYENIIGSHGVGERNDNGERLVDFCGLNNLVVTGTISPHKLIHKQTWTSPGGKTKKSNRPCVSE